MKPILFITIAVLVASVYFLHANHSIDWFRPAESSKSGKKKIHEPASPNIQVIKKWDLPEVLMEISGLSYIDETRFACVQDENGAIYIYNAGTEKIEREIPFGEPGDYEGIALSGNTAYVVRSDGHIFEVTGINTTGSAVKEFATSLTVQQNVEGICFDKNNNRLLIAIKGEDAGSKGHKGIYSFDLGTKTFIDRPVYKIDLSHSVFGKVKAKKPGAVIEPSAIAVHPATADIYITDGPGARLLVMDSSGTIKTLSVLGKQTFSQPEGISFSSTGKMFISNEGKKNTPGNIIEVAMLP